MTKNDLNNYISSISDKYIYTDLLGHVTIYKESYAIHLFSSFYGYIYFSLDILHNDENYDNSMDMLHILFKYHDWEESKSMWNIILFDYFSYICQTHLCDTQSVSNYLYSDIFSSETSMPKIYFDNIYCPNCGKLKVFNWDKYKIKNLNLITSPHDKLDENYKYFISTEDLKITYDNLKVLSLKYKDCLWYTPRPEQYIIFAKSYKIISNLKYDLVNNIKSKRSIRSSTIYDEHYKGDKKISMDIKNLKYFFKQTMSMSSTKIPIIPTYVNNSITLDVYVNSNTGHFIQLHSRPSLEIKNKDADKNKQDIYKLMKQFILNHETYVNDFDHDLKFEKQFEQFIKDVCCVNGGGIEYRNPSELCKSIIVFESSNQTTQLWHVKDYGLIKSHHGEKLFKYTTSCSNVDDLKIMYKHFNKVPKRCNCETKGNVIFCEKCGQKIHNFDFFEIEDEEKNKNE